MIKRILIISALLIFQIYADNSPFIFVFIDGKTESKIGKFPYSRDIYAKAIKVVSKNGAKAVVLKYFIDEPKDQIGDIELSESFTEIPVFLQCRLNITQNNPNILPDRFLSSEIAINKPDNIISGISGWMPLKIFSDNCYDVGFVDIYNRKNNRYCPILGLYQNTIIKSLPIKIFEYLFSENIEIENRTMIFRNNSYRLTSKYEYKLTFSDKVQLKIYSFIDLLEDKIGRDELSGKIVILGYGGNRQGLITTPIGELKAHEYFGYILLSMYGDFK
jgi:hypothetical protein